MVNFFRIDYIYFGVGLKYFIILRVCNIVDLCIIVVIDGVVMDNSFFIIGVVIDGIGV